MTTRRALFVTVAVCLTATGLHLSCVNRFGWFRDELYYIACGEHLAWGYVDHPPAVAAMAAFATHWLGHSLLAVRALPITLGVATTAASVLLAHRLGARAIGLVLTAVAVALTPTFLFVFHTLSMNSLEPLLWTAFCYLLHSVARSPSRLRHAALGLVVGVGVLTKHSMLFLVFASAIAWMLTGRARSLATRGFALTLALAFVLTLPHVVWQLRHGLPAVEFYTNAQAHKLVRMSALGFVAAQVTLAGPGNLPLWLAGLAGLSARRAHAAHRTLGFTYVVLLGLFTLLGAKAYYLLPYYPVLFAGGAASLERWATRRPRSFAPPVVLAVALGLGAATIPLALPILGVDATVAWGKRLGLSPPKAERSDLGALPQHFADMFGWEELVRNLARVRDGLPEAERDQLQIVVMNYGEAGAIDWLGAAFGLPHALSPHNSYHGWGTPRAGAPVLLVLAADARGLDPSTAFHQVELVAEHDAENAMPYERHLRIYLCRGWKRSPESVWAELKRFI
ncbi:MAG: glycosyltransferase family 39 protein [Myxococcales bacterium]|nr:glycosyltransferase family 39 protein [Myxococcales bacterium]